MNKKWPPKFKKDRTLAERAADGCPTCKGDGEYEDVLCRMKPCPTCAHTIAVAEAYAANTIQDVTHVIQKHQPGGSPPPGNLAMLAAWVFEQWGEQRYQEGLEKAVKALRDFIHRKDGHPGTADYVCPELVGVGTAMTDSIIHFIELISVVLAAVIHLIIFGLVLWIAIWLSTNVITAKPRPCYNIEESNAT
jgi:hypothetical protein